MKPATTPHKICIQLYFFIHLVLLIYHILLLICGVDLSFLDPSKHPIIVTIISILMPLSVFAALISRNSNRTSLMIIMLICLFNILGAWGCGHILSFHHITIALSALSMILGPHTILLDAMSGFNKYVVIACVIWTVLLVVAAFVFFRNTNGNTTFDEKSDSYIP